MQEIIVSIEGMMCGNCESHMTKAFKEAFNTKKVESSHSKCESVIITEDEIGDDSIKEVVENAGYTFKGVERKPYEKKGFFKK